MRKNRISVICVAVFLLIGLSACASNRVIVDTKGVNMAQYERDRSECEVYAGQVDTGGQVARSAGFGAAVGALIASIFGNSRDVGRGAAAGGVAGGAKGAVRSDNEKERVLRNCLRGRGYRVLN